MTQLIVVDDHIFLRAGVKVYCKNHPEISVVGEAGDGETLFRFLSVAPVDMVLLGVNPSNGMDCLRITRRLRRDYPTIKILALANENTAETVNSMMQAGIDGFIGKRQADKVELLAAIQKVMSGEGYVGRIDTVEI